MTILLYVLAINWGLPLIACWTYVLWLRFVTNDVAFVGWERVWFLPVARWKLVSKYSWYAKAWQDWYGVGMFMNIIHRDEDSTDDDVYVQETVTHELRHCLQWFIGLLQPILYVGHFLYLLIVESLKKEPTRHPYLDNWFERDARKSAGQLVDVPRGNWTHGPNDLNPWAFNPSPKEIKEARQAWWRAQRSA